MLAVLRQRHFALLWGASLISEIGTVMLYIALPFYVYAHTGSTLATGAMFVVQSLPAVALGSLVGVFVDRWDRRRTMMVADLARAVLILLLLTVRARSGLWAIYVVAGVEATISLFFYPASGALVPRLVGEGHLTAANSLGAIRDNVIRMVGPSIGAAALALVGLPGLVLLDAASYLCSASMIALIAVPVPPEPASVPDTTVPAVAAGIAAWPTVWREWLDGLRLVTRDRTLSALFLVTGIVAFGSGLFTILVVVFVRVILHGTVQVFGWLMTAQGVGGVIGGLLITSVSRVVPARYLLALGFGGPGLLLLTMINVPVLPLVLGLFVLAGLLIVGAEVSAQTLLQTSVTDQYRGRVLAAFGTTLTLVNLGSMGLGSAVGDYVGVVLLLDVAGVLFFCGGMIAVVLVRGPAPGIGSLQEATQQTARTTRS